MGNRTGILNRILSAVCLLLLLAGAALAAPSTLRVRQAYLDYPSLTVYADLLDASGKPFVPGGAEQLTATVGGRAFDVSRWSAFSAKNDGVLIIFLVDTSASIGQNRFTELQETVSGWIRRMGPSDR
ncbi:MAG TPA: VWA domain-containing protein, partial [Aminobacteriaceae bacterium]|nr:VWA domain-containing protein [Aminobacteriaceae bacterium]